MKSELVLGYLTILKANAGKTTKVKDSITARQRTTFSSMSNGDMQTKFFEHSLRNTINVVLLQKWPFYKQSDFKRT